MKFSVDLNKAVIDKNNNFNLLRFGAAIAVIISHSFILTVNMPNAWPKILGFLAVNCFFVISGFLVTQSLIQRNSLLSFVWARVLRIYPALILAVLLCVFVVGPLHTTISLNDYFSDPLTYQFLFTNATLFGGSVQNYLPGVFNIGLTDGKVNAPLWTLFYELYMYLSVALIALLCGLFSGLRKSINLAFFRYIVFALSGVLFVMFIADIGLKYLSNHFISSMVRFGALFYMGAALYLVRSKITLNLKMMLVICILVLASSVERVTFNFICYLFLGYALLFFAYIPKGVLLRFNQLGDYSYGLYIFAYPIQQSLVHSFPTISTIELMLFSLTISSCGSAALAT